MRNITVTNERRLPSYVQKKRLTWIDITKGICILGIVAFHFFQNYHDNLKIVDFFKANGAKLGFAAVDIFFVIAGFNISYNFALIEEKKQIQLSSINWLNWLKKKFIRLYPAYWLAFLMTCILYFFIQHPIKIKLEFNTILLLLGLTSYQEFKVVNPGFWFFSVIVQGFLITPLIFYITKFKPKNILFVAIIFGSIEKIVLWLLIIFAKDSFWHSFFLQNNFIGSYFFQFCLGLYWGFKYYNQQDFSKQDFYYSFILFGIGILIYILTYIFNIDVVYMTGIDICFTPIFFLAFYYFFDRSESSFRDRDFPSERRYNKLLYWLAVLGVNSYQIYLIHQPLFIVGFPLLKEHLNLTGYLQLISVSIIISIVLFFYVKLLIGLELLVKKYILKPI